jgi:hypothetical protein
MPKRRSDFSMRIQPLLVILALLLCASCSVMQPLPTSDSGDPNVGGGQNGPSGSNLGGGGSDTGGGIIAPENQSPTAVRPGASGAPQVDLPLIGPGESIEQGALTFSIGLMEITPDQVFIEYTIDGLGQDYQPLDPPVTPVILLTDGRLLPAIREEGSGSPGSETVQLIFPAVPQGTDLFLLLIENNWNGQPETWRIPVNIGRG